MHPRHLRPATAPDRARLAAGLTALALAACSAGAQTQLPTSAGSSGAATLTIEAPSGAAVHVDGIQVGIAPLEQPLELEPGSHDVVVSSSGHLPYQRDLHLAPGTTRTLAVDLETTTQRTVSWVLLTAGAAALSTGIVLGVLSVVEQRQARELDGQDGDLAPAQQQTYDKAISARDDYRVGSGFAAAAGLGLFLIGGALFVLDDPTLPGLADEDDAGPNGPASADLEVQPLIGPSVAGGSLTLRFR